MHFSDSQKIYINEGERIAGIPKWSIYAVLAITALVYLRALFNDFNLWDDYEYIINNPDIKDLNAHGLYKIFSSYYVGLYQPLTMLVYMLLNRIFGLSPFVFHLTNVLLHLVNTWLVFKLAEKLSGKQFTAIVVSVLFAVHPMHVESVAWISECKDVLYAMFFLLSLLMYLRYAEPGYRKKFYYGSLILFIASVLSKPVAVTLPVLLIAIDLYRGRKLNKRTLSEKLPFLLISLIFGIVTILSQKGAMSDDLSFTYSWFNKIFFVGYAFAFYIVKLIAPFGLCAMHYYPGAGSNWLPWEYYASLPFLLLLVWLVIRRSSFREELLFGAFFFLICISLMVQIVPVGIAIAAERYSYIAYIGLFYIAGQWLAGIEPKRIQKYVLILFTLLVASFSVLSFMRIGTWKDGIVLFTDVIEKNPRNEHAWWARGTYKSTMKDTRGAMKDFNNAISLCPAYAKAYLNRGMLKAGTGDFNAALVDLNAAVQIIPDYTKAYTNRGYIKAMLGDYKGALDDLDHSIKINPNDAAVYYDRGVTKYNMGNTTGACLDWEKAAGMGDPDAARFLQQYCRQVPAPF
jgi:protein O-mannosyl-transferase